MLLDPILEYDDDTNDLFKGNEKPKGNENSSVQSFKSKSKKSKNNGSPIHERKTKLIMRSSPKTQGIVIFLQYRPQSKINTSTYAFKCVKFNNSGTF